MRQRSNYRISGDRKGRVTVKDASGKTIHIFKMQEGVVREVFLLDDAKTVGASQKGRTVFWDLLTGQRIHHFDQRIYGFSHDETRFFTYNREGVFLYAYPDLKRICELAKGPMVGPEAFVFSPDDCFLSILFASGRPASDQYYPQANPVRRGIRYTKVFDLKHCQEIQQFSRLKAVQLGKFSENSKFYDLKDTIVTIEGVRSTGSWRFDLTNNELKKIGEHKKSRYKKEEK